MFSRENKGTSEHGGILDSGDSLIMAGAYDVQH